MYAEVDQPFAASEWTIDHGLGVYPSVTIIDSSGEQVIGTVFYDSPNRVRVRFGAAFSGRAILT